MITDFTQLLDAARQAKDGAVVSVACAHDQDVLLAVEEAIKGALARFILVGDPERIERTAQENNLNLAGSTVLRAANDQEAVYLAAKEVSEGRAHMIQKGLVDSGVFMKAVLDKSLGLRGEGLLSHVAVFRASGYDRFIFVTDGALNLAPELEDKKSIVANATLVAHALGLIDPIVAVLCATEKINEKMPATLDAQKLVELNEKGVISGCRIGGPFALDNAVSLAAAEHKAMTNPLAGRADILLVPNLESGNMLYKSLVYFANASVAGNVIGARVPVLMNSRADSADAKLLSLALGIVVSQYQKQRR